MEDLHKIATALKWAKNYLNSKKIQNSTFSAEYLLSYILGMSRTSLYANFDMMLTENQQNNFRKCVLKRSSSYPLQYISGISFFRYIDVNVGPGVLIPRPETEKLVDVALDYLNFNNVNKPIVLDVCTGTACIAISLAREYNIQQIYATDISKDALMYAKKNICKYNLQSKIRLINCNLADDLLLDTKYLNQFNLIISNPPYIPDSLFNKLNIEVNKYEPKLALSGGSDGLCYYYKILDLSKFLLKNGGLLCIELHEDNLECAAKYAIEHSWDNVKIHKDLNNKNRILTAIKS